MHLKYLLLSIFSIAVSAFSLALDQWYQRADFGGNGRHRASSTSIGNKGYMGLGHYNGTGVETYLADWWEYDLGTNSWTQKADYIGNIGFGELGAHAFNYAGFAFVGLGELDPQSLYRYDPTTNSWAFVSDPPGGPAFRDTKSFQIGNKTYFTRLWTDMFYEYDIDLNTWTIKNPMPFDGYYSYSAFSIGNKGYIKRYGELWEYDPAFDSWTAKAPFPGQAVLSSIALVQYGKGYIVCGYGPATSDVLSEVWEYSPDTDSWLQFPNFPGSSRRYSTGFSFGDRSFLGTGTNGTNFGDFWEFAPYAQTDELFDASNFHVYPNLATDVVHFKADNNMDFTIQITDVSGRITGTVSSVTGNASFPCDKLDRGVYFYSVEMDRRIVYFDRFIVR